MCVCVVCVCVCVCVCVRFRENFNFYGCVAGYFFSFSIFDSFYISWIDNL